MILLDTNVVSELVKASPHETVIAFIGAHEAEVTYISAVTAGELRFGIALLPIGRRREALDRAVEQMLAIDFRHRVLPFDVSAARAYAEIAASRRRMGRPMGMADAQIAAIARVHGAALATRNVRDFDACGISVVNPWDASVTE